MFTAPIQMTGAPPPGAPAPHMNPAFFNPPGPPGPPQGGPPPPGYVGPAPNARVNFKVVFPHFILPNL